MRGAECGGGGWDAGRNRCDSVRLHWNTLGVPTLAAVRQAVEALEEMDMKGKVQLIVSGGIRTGADVAKAIALGADAVSIGQAVLMALGCNSETYVQNGVYHSALEDYHALGTAPGIVTTVILASAQLG